MKPFPPSRKKKKLELRAKILSSIRRFFDKAGYLEVETPCRIPAPTPEVHIEAEMAGEWYLHTSPELCMKQLLAAGYPRIYQICKCFRHGERGRRHLPEMTMLEWYTADCDYTDMMSQTEALIRFVAEDMGKGDMMSYQGQPIDLSKPWDRLPLKRAFERYAAMTMEATVRKDLFDEIMVNNIEPNLRRDKPVFVYDYPVRHGSLARLKEDDPAVVERFELYIGGLEICNAFSELTDPDEQRQRFEAEIAYRQSQGKVTYPIPKKFLDDLQQMPSAAGNALGIDRLIMLFTDSARIDDVVAFVPEVL